MRLEAGPDVNQRVKSAVGTGKKIELDSRAIELEIKASTAFRQAFRIAVYPLFATKLLTRVGRAQKFTKK